jgi:hypothetical protein
MDSVIHEIAWLLSARYLVSDARVLSELTTS